MLEGPIKTGRDCSIEPHLRVGSKMLKYIIPIMIIIATAICLLGFFYNIREFYIAAIIIGAMTFVLSCVGYRREAFDEKLERYISR